MKYIKYFEQLKIEDILNSNLVKPNQEDIDDVNDIFLSLSDKYEMVDIEKSVTKSGFYYLIELFPLAVHILIVYPGNYVRNNEVYPELKDDIKDFKNTLINHGYEIQDESGEYGTTLFLKKPLTHE